MRKFISMVVVFFAAGHAFANSGNQKVLAMLKKNPVVNAAVVEAKKFSGAKTCKYKVESNEPDEFEKGTTFDYSADISCTHKEAGAIIRVKGRMFSDVGPQEFVLSIEFAG